MPTPTSTSVGASVPNAIRDRATSVISVAATHLPVLRQRPRDQRVQHPISSPVRAVTCSAGNAQPPQPPQLVWKSTPNGRGRRAIANRPSVTLLATTQTTSHTIRCRQRRHQQRQQQPVVQRVKHPPGADAGHAPQERRHPRPN